MEINKCNRCWKVNLAEIHTCTPWYYFGKHERLKFICEKIGYENIDYSDRWYKNEDWWNYTLNKYEFDLQDFRKLDVREIIFTQEFMDKFTTIDMRRKWNIEPIPCSSITETFNQLLMKNLDNPVDYLYNLIKK